MAQSGYASAAPNGSLLIDQQLELSAANVALDAKRPVLALAILDSNGF
jgi:hypothetical protein